MTWNPDLDPLSRRQRSQIVHDDELSDRTVPSTKRRLANASHSCTYSIISLSGTIAIILSTDRKFLPLSSHSIAQFWNWIFMAPIILILFEWSLLLFDLFLHLLLNSFCLCCCLKCEIRIIFHSPLLAFPGCFTFTTVSHVLNGHHRVLRRFNGSEAFFRKSVESACQIMRRNDEHREKSKINNMEQ